MILEDVRKTLDAKVLCGDSHLSKEAGTVCGSDLMSDVLTFMESGSLLLTGLTNPQVVRTAEMAGLVAVCFVRGKKPQADTIKLAEAKQIPLLATNLSMYEACGRLYKEGVSGCGNFG